MDTSIRQGNIQQGTIIPNLYQREYKDCFGQPALGKFCVQEYHEINLLLCPNHRIHDNPPSL